MYEIEYGYTSNPGYYDILVGIVKNLKWVAYSNASRFWQFTPPIWQFYSKFDMNQGEIFSILNFAILITILRYSFENFMYKNVISRIGFDKAANGRKFCECSWKFIVYSILWSYTLYLLVFSGKYDYFDETHNINNGWSFQMKVPNDIGLLYMLETGFYIHSIYATLYMDTKRKDNVLMLIHHVITILLLLFSYGFKFHRFGAIVLLCHDVQDILMEFTKCNVYLINRNGKHYRHNETIAMFGFIAFGFTWVLFRLYWFPLKVIYGGAVISLHNLYSLIDCLFTSIILAIIFNVLLFAILMLNIYWFHLILKILVRLFKKDPNRGEDIRDIDDEKKKNK